MKALKEAAAEYEKLPSYIKRAGGEVMPRLIEAVAAIEKRIQVLEKKEGEENGKS